MTMRCPECGQTAHTRSSEYLSPVTKLSYYQCKNIYCSCTFNTMESLNRVICKTTKQADETSQLTLPKLPQTIGRYGNSCKLKDRHQQP